MPADLSEQIQRFEEKYAENPDSLVFARLADLYRKAGDADRALTLLGEGLERHPDYLSAHIVRARCLRDLGREDEAEEAFAGVLEHDEQNLVALRGLAELARDRGDLDQAERRYEELLALDPHNEDARSALDELVEGEVAGPDDGPAADPDARPGRDAGFDEGDTSGADTDTDADDDVPWWRSEEPDDTGEPDGPDGRGEPDAPDESIERAGTEQPDETAAPEGREEPAPVGADQSDVFSLAEPEDRDGEASGGEAEAPVGPDAPGHASREEAEFLGLDEGDGDAGASPEDAVDGSLPAEQELTERIEEIADTDEESPLEADEESEDLLTETLADLYETQGFYREAVEMYEELLEERPEDEELRARLEAARSAMGGSGAADDAPGTTGRGRASARAHLQALLRGEAEAERDSLSGDPETAP